MQIDIEPLAPCQRAIIEKIDKETKEMDAKVQQILKSSDCDVFYKGCYTTAIEANEKLQSILNGRKNITNKIYSHLFKNKIFFI